MLPTLNYIHENYGIPVDPRVKRRLVAAHAVRIQRQLRIEPPEHPLEGSQHHEVVLTALLEADWEGTVERLRAGEKPAVELIDSADNEMLEAVTVDLTEIQIEEAEHAFGSPF